MDIIFVVNALICHLEVPSSQTDLRHIPGNEGIFLEAPYV